MVHIIVKNNKFRERYIQKGIEACEKDGIRKGDAFIAINQMTDRGVSVDERREIIEKFIKREKPI